MSPSKLKCRVGRPWPVLAAALLAAGCGDGEDPVDPVVGPPDLTGTYTMESLVGGLTGNVTLTPPAVEGTFTVQQLTTNETEATGTQKLNLFVPDGMGGIGEVVDSGTYVVRTDGTWEQAGTLFQGIGTYTLEGSTLTVVVVEPAAFALTSVWRRQ